MQMLRTCAWCGLELPCSRRYFFSPAGVAMCWVCFYKQCAENGGPEAPAHYQSWEAYEARHAKKVRPPAKKPEYRPEYRRAYQKAHAAKYATYARNRHARKMAAGGTHTQEDVDLQYKAQRGLCWWCGEPLGDKYHVDHRVPIDKGGTNDAGNLVIACPHCNLSKHDRLPQEWNGRLL